MIRCGTRPNAPKRGDENRPPRTTYRIPVPNERVSSLGSLGTAIRWRPRGTKHCGIWKPATHYSNQLAAPSGRQRYRIFESSNLRIFESSRLIGHRGHSPSSVRLGRLGGGCCVGFISIVELVDDRGALRLRSSAIERADEGIRSTSGGGWHVGTRVCGAAMFSNMIEPETGAVHR
jgi:hypothetical protein